MAKPKYKVIETVTKTVMVQTWGVSADDAKNGKAAVENIKAQLEKQGIDLTGKKFSFEVLPDE